MTRPQPKQYPRRRLRQAGFTDPLKKSADDQEASGDAEDTAHNESAEASAEDTTSADSTEDADSAVRKRNLPMVPRELARNGRN